MHLSIHPNPFVSSVLTCFGKVFPVITEILEEGDTLTSRVVPPRGLQEHHLHTIIRLVLARGTFKERVSPSSLLPGAGGSGGRGFPGGWLKAPPTDILLRPPLTPVPAATSIADVFRRAIWSSRLSCRKPGSCLAKSTISCTETMASSVK